MPGGDVNTSHQGQYSKQNLWGTGIDGPERMPVAILARHVGAAGLLSNCLALDPWAQDSGKGNVPVHKGFPLFPDTPKDQGGMICSGAGGPHTRSKEKLLWRVQGATQCRVPWSERSLCRFLVKKTYLFILWEYCN